MSVAEVFLRNGKACTRVDTFGATLNERYSQWALLVVFQRQWFCDKRLNKLYAPALQLLFASSSAVCMEDITTALDGDQWFLLFYNATQTCREVLWEKKGVDLISNLLQAVPCGLHPSFFSVICVTIGDTHDRLELFSDRGFLHFKGCVERTLIKHGVQEISVRRHRVAIGGLLEKQDNSGDYRLPLFIEAAIQWVCRNTPDAVDVSAPSQKGNDAVLALLPQLNKFLYTRTFYERDENMCDALPAVVTAGNRGLLPPKLVEERRVAVNNLKRRVGNVASFTLPALEGFEETENSWHVLLVQKLFEKKIEVSFENLDRGQLEPQPIGAELHIMRDGGEVLYLQSRLCDERSFDTVYENIMHDDGEVFVQLTPLEGIAFDDIDRYLDFISTTGQELYAERPLEPLCEGSCSGYTFPKVVFRRPTGAVVKDTVISSPHVEIVEESPRTLEEWEVARQALKYLSEHITPLDSVHSAFADIGGRNCGGYTLAACVERVPAPTHDDTCALCGRCRDKLLRCGGCRVEMYCCKKHQMLDWNNGHRKNCKLWKKAREEYELHVKPFIQQHGATLYETPSASNVATLFQFFAECQWVLQGSPAPVVHIIGIDSGVKEFLSELARRVDEVRAYWQQLRVFLCSDTISDEEHNAVYAICEDSSFLRTQSTAVLGDVWHTRSGDEAVARAVMLVRLYNTKYNILVANCPDIAQGGVSAPSAVVSFGNLLGDGMSYFVAAAEVLADRFVGFIPVMCTEPSLVSAHRTLSAISARVQLSDVLKTDLKKKLLALFLNPDSLIRLNLNCMGREMLDVHGKQPVSDNASKVATKAFPLILHPNLYLFCLPCVA